MNLEGPDYDDATIEMDWQGINFPRSVFERYGLTTFASFQVATEAELLALDNIGATRVDAIKKYLDCFNRRLRLDGESFLDRVYLVYGSIHNVPCLVAGNVYGRHELGHGADLDRLLVHADLHYLADVAARSPEEIARYLREPSLYPERILPRLDLETYVGFFIQWLWLQRVWG